jgi:beta-glucanase (GH16 family)
MLSKILISISLGICLISQCSQQVSSTSGTEKPKMIWFDEFNTDGAPDSTIWGYDIGDGCPHVCGWGNDELEYYTSNPGNVRIEDGHLIIEAHKQEIEGKSFSSTRLVSKNKKDWKYGRMEVRAKLPTGLGTWPAIWMLPTDNEYGGWPNSGEIDVMEHVGYAKDTIYGTIHTDAYNHMKGTHKTGEIFVPDAEEAFHTYAINWTPEKIEWYIDNVMYHSVENERLTSAEWPFDQKFHLIINLAVGGKWGGKHGVAEDIWPQKMMVDYVRVYE